MYAKQCTRSIGKVCFQNVPCEINVTVKHKEQRFDTNTSYNLIGF